MATVMTRFRQHVQNTFQRLGWEVRRNSYPNSEEILLRRFLDAARPDLVFDVGANLGQYAGLLRKCGYHGRIVSFEAQRSVHAKLTAAAGQDPNWIIAPCCALGREAGETEINVAGNSLSSSLLPMLATHLSAAPESRYVSKERIRLARLDEVAPTDMLGPNCRLLLKIDTQGFEEEVLAGAGDVVRVCGSNATGTLGDAAVSGSTDYATHAGVLRPDWL